MKERCRALLGSGLVQGGFLEEGTFELKPIGGGYGVKGAEERSRQRERCGLWEAGTGARRAGGC